MAARKTPPPRKASTTPKKPAPKKVTAQKSIQKQYGLIKNSSGAWVAPDKAFLERQLTAMGYGANQPVVNGVAIGGMRWLTGAGTAAKYTGKQAVVDLDAGGVGTATGSMKEYRAATRAGNGAGAGGVGAGGEMPAPGDGGLFTTGVSGKTGAFVTEKGGKGPAGDAAETNTTKTKKKKARTKKLVKRTTKKTSVKGKTIRKALRSPGITKSDKKVYAKVAKQATPKLSSRLRVADRRKGK